MIKKLDTQCYIMTLKRSSKACRANQIFPFSTEKNRHLHKLFIWLHFSLLQENVMIHLLKVPTSLQESPGWSLSWCLDRVLGKMNPSCDMSYFLLRISAFFPLLQSHKKTHRNTLQQLPVIRMTCCQLKLLSCSFIIWPL